MYKRITSDQKEKCEKMIQDFCNRHGIEFSKNSDIVEICRQLGFMVFSLNLEEDFPGIDGVILADDRKKLIGINNRIDIRNARFVIAHELSHYIYNEMSENKLKVVAAKDKILHNDEKSIQEHMMDYMAAVILVPELSFKEDIKSVHVSKVKTMEEAREVPVHIVNKLSEEYNVDNEVISRRLVEVSRNE